MVGFRGGILVQNNLWTGGPLWCVPHVTVKLNTVPHTLHPTVLQSLFQDTVSTHVIRRIIQITCAGLNKNPKSPATKIKEDTQIISRGETVLQQFTSNAGILTPDFFIKMNPGLKHGLWDGRETGRRKTRE